MNDIPVGAEISREEFTRVLQISNAQLHRLACECHRALCLNSSTMQPVTPDVNSNM
jgi:hypothetical protein